MSRLATVRIPVHELSQFQPSLISLSNYSHPRPVQKLHRQGYFEEINWLHVNTIFILFQDWVFLFSTLNYEIMSGYVICKAFETLGYARFGNKRRYM